ncbi:F-type H+-transporting ATPase subunit epsilon [Desulfosalsimonas propionicica]|uniref:ATP synthase epsilon chain n=1 Tax=Desulfosalsimonas propionicica TaxID=332175 RepID=A0A7W0CAV3_9BACT|nr:F0F1 ATP synthase subunit epsilon [Desulfosalsimonas propionicica]MBA2882358.1 F-type H+-transporting ATPase subunit epsilon [Desulfosalsimonas propionicica]
MAENIQLEIVTPEKYVVSESSQIVMAPGTLGEFGVLSGHTPFLTSLQVGKVRYRNEKGDEHYVFVSGGFAEALPDKVTILAESAERLENIDYERAKDAYERAQQRLAGDKEDVDFARARAAMQRALTRMNIVQGSGSTH